MSDVDMSKYEDTPCTVITRENGSTVSFYKSKASPEQFIPILNDAPINWTKLFQAGMDAGEIRK